MVKQLFINNLPEFSYGGSGLSKFGGRTEYRLPLDTTVLSVADQIGVDMPLRFASIIVAHNTDEPDQDFHEDGTYDSVNAIVYLTDVPHAENGAIEFESVGPIIGQRGSAVVYGAREHHRGIANRTSYDRIALGLVFSNDERPVMTIGGSSTVTCVGSGTVLITGHPNGPITVQTTYSVDFSGDLTLTAIPNTGYVFVNWTDSNNAVYSTNSTIIAHIQSSALHFTATFVAGSDPVCFLGNAPVLTPTGYSRIDSLKVGDTVSTPTGAVKINKVFRKEYNPSQSTNPYVIPKGRFGATEAVAISPKHKVEVNGEMTEARFLGLTQLTMRKPFVYYNLELPNYENITVAGISVESMAPLTRITITMDQFATIIANKYNELTPELVSAIKRNVRLLADGRVDVPAIKK